MNSFLYISSIIFLMVILYWLQQAFTYKPKFKHKNRFRGFLNEGGRIALVIYLTIALFLSLLITFITLLFNFLEK